MSQNHKNMTFHQSLENLHSLQELERNSSLQDIRNMDELYLHIGQFKNSSINQSEIDTSHLSHKNEGPNGPRINFQKVCKNEGLEQTAQLLQYNSLQNTQYLFLQSHGQFKCQ